MIIEIILLFGVSLIAENVAEARNILRQEQDEFGVQSHLKYEQAVSLGHFDTEVEPIIISTSKSTSNTFLLTYSFPSYLYA